jgi:hypothetical protein
LIENGRPKELAHLLFLCRVARESKGMAATREDCASDVPVEGGEKGKRAFFEREDSIAAAELNVVGGSDVVNGGRIDTESADCII